MKKGLFSLMITMVGAFAGYWIYFHCATAPVRTMLNQSGGEMQWLRREYSLSDAQFTRIDQLHQAYAPKCDLLCKKIDEANARLDALVGANRELTPEVEGAMSECLAVQDECRRALFEHSYAVSREMPPEAGRRYLEMMTKRIVQPGMHQSLNSEASK